MEAYWWYALVIVLALPLIIAAYGWLMVHHPSRKRLWSFGYGSPLSRESQEAWDFAQDYCGRCFMKIGVIVIIPAFLSLFLVTDAEADTIALLMIAVIVLEMVCMMAALPLTERALKRKFGNRRGLRKREMRPRRF